MQTDRRAEPRDELPGPTGTPWGCVISAGRLGSGLPISKLCWPCVPSQAEIPGHCFVGRSEGRFFSPAVTSCREPEQQQNKHT